jgi:hypothetical protein
MAPMVTEANYTIYSGVRSATRQDEGTTDVYVLHRVLYPQVHDNGVKKTKKRYNRLKERYVVFLRHNTFVVSGLQVLHT